ncbi:MAG: hypothetical protein WCH62_05510 [Candidatus Omnitrophota bacterium]
MNKKSHTIIEILVVLSALIIIVWIAFPRFQAMWDQGYTAQAKAQMSMVKAAVVSYYLNHSQSGVHIFPPSTTTLQATYLYPATPQFISNIFYQPFVPGSQEYNYLLSLGGKFFVLWSVGVNKAGGFVSISDAGVVSGKDSDDICVTNGSGC